MKIGTRRVLSLLAGLLVAGSGWAQAPAPLAIVDGVPVTEADVQEVSTQELESLENERLQFEADFQKRQHEVIANALEQVITDRLLDAESRKQGIERSALLDQEVSSQLRQPSAAEIESVYQANIQQLINVPREEALARVRQFLNQQTYDATLKAYIERLKSDYAVESRLEPYRVEVASAGYPGHGPDDAPITLVEFSDFECPYCRRTQPVLEQIEARYGGSIRFVFRQFPLTAIHPRAQKAAEASLCADDQGEFWPMHDLLFADPIELEIASLKYKAGSLGLDAGVFDECLDSAKYAERVDREIKDGIRAGVTGTPTIFINGRPVTGAMAYETYAAIIEDELATAEDD